MDVSLAEKVVEGIEKFLEYSNTYNLSIPIVGGEPLLADVKVNRTLFRALYERIGSKNPNFVVFFNTNLISLMTEYVKLFCDYPVNVCASFDPGKTRFKNKELLDIWYKNVKHLVKNIGDRLYISVTVCEPVFRDFDLYDFLERLEVKNLMLSVFSPLGNAEDNLGEFFVSRRRISLGLIAFSETAPSWLNVYFTKKDLIRESQINESGVSGGVECWNDCFNTFSILPDGGVTFAGFCFSSDILGNIISDPPEKILYHPLRLEFMMRKTAYEECLPCEYRSFCRCGCISLSRLSDPTDCSGLKVYLDYVFEGVIPDDYYEFVEKTWFRRYIS